MERNLNEFTIRDCTDELNRLQDQLVMLSRRIDTPILNSTETPLNAVDRFVFGRTLDDITTLINILNAEVQNPTGEPKLKHVFGRFYRK
jgi:hypothetical protein